MGAIELDQLLLLAGVATGIVPLLSTLAVAVYTRRIRHRLLQLDVLQRSIQRLCQTHSRDCPDLGFICDNSRENSSGCLRS